MLRPQPRSLAAVFGDLVGLLLLELRRDMGLGPALVGAFLRFLLSLFLPLGVQLRRVLFSLLLLLIGFAFLLGLAFLGALLIFSLAVGFTFRRFGLSFGVALLAGSRFSAASSFFSRSARAKEARSLAVCLVPSAMVRPRGPGYPFRMPSVAILFVVIFALPLLLLPRPPLLVILHLSLAISLPVFFLGPVVHVPVTGGFHGRSPARLVPVAPSRFRHWGCRRGLVVFRPGGVPVVAGRPAPHWRRTMDWALN